MPEANSPTATADPPVSEVVTARLARLGMLANGLGALLVALFAGPLTPSTISSDDYVTVLVRTAPAFVIYMAVTLWLGRVRVQRRFSGLLDWVDSGERPTEQHRALALRYPLDFTIEAARYWVGAAIVFPLIVATVSPPTAVALSITILLGGTTACALQYLLVERAVRPVIARALAGGPPPRAAVPGVGTRLTMAWSLATGVPLLGVVGLLLADLAGADLGKRELSLAVLFLVALAIVLGLWAILVAARSVTDPLGSLRGAAERIEQGDLDARVEVDDASEVGRLQAGFNRMAAGLAERERLRDLFGRHVGRDVARAALQDEAGLGGEEREIGALFVDLVGSTRLGATHAPTEVVGLLNEFFAIVVEAAESHAGWVNKFEGDAALCVFGAPNPVDDPAGDALAAARELRDRLRAELPQVDFGIGVSAGVAVAGNVGAEERFEYTVIGDPVNEASRLCELAKSRPERLLASEAALEKARSEEAGRWSLGDSVVLRGRPESTRLATAA